MPPLRGEDSRRHFLQNRILNEPLHSSAKRSSRSALPWRDFPTKRLHGIDSKELPARDSLLFQPVQAPPQLLFQEHLPMRRTRRGEQRPEQVGEVILVPELQFGQLRSRPAQREIVL